VRQILHVLAKDIRRFWPEVLISLVTTAAWACIYPVQWLPEDSYGGPGLIRLFQHTSQMQTLANTLTGLLPASWWFLIARVIHAENLLGDRQFWLTRPYKWPKLLAAKAIFIVLFVYVPFVVAQGVLLAEAGFSPFISVPGMLFNLLLVTAVIVLPLMALATVTSSFARMTLAILGVALCIALLVYASTFAESSGVSAPYSDRYSAPAVLLICVSVIVVQYAKRKVVLSRMLLATLPLLIGVIAVYLPNGAMVQAAYPVTRNVLETPMQLTYRVGQRNRLMKSEGSTKDMVEIHVPLEAEGVGQGHMVKIDDVMAEAEGPDKKRWVIPWSAVYNDFFLPGEWESSVTLKMKRAEYEAMKLKAVTLRLRFALTETRMVGTDRVALQESDFAIPGYGRCSGYMRKLSPMGGATLSCWTAWHGPSLRYVTATASTTPCGVTTKKKDGAEDDASSSTDNSTGTSKTVNAWVGGLDEDPAEFGMTSVWSHDISLSDGEYMKPRFLCPGTVLNFARYELVRRVSTDVRVDGFRLPE
jgi:hypothetical protein